MYYSFTQIRQEQHHHWSNLQCLVRSEVTIRGMQWSDKFCAGTRGNRKDKRNQLGLDMLEILCAFLGGNKLNLSQVMRYDIKFVLQIKNGTNCMFMYSFIVFVGVRFLMKPGTLVLGEKLLMMIPYGSKMFSFYFVLCVVRLLEWRWKGESLFWRRMKYICAGV